MPAFALDKPFTWLIILVIVLIIFGAKRIPEIGSGLGQGIRAFKEETRNAMNETPETTETTGTLKVPPTLQESTSVKTVEATPVNTPVAAGSSGQDYVVRRTIRKLQDGTEEVVEERVARNQ